MNSQRETYDGAIDLLRIEARTVWRLRNIIARVIPNPKGYEPLFDAIEKERVRLGELIRTLENTRDAT